MNSDACGLTNKKNRGVNGVKRFSLMLALAVIMVFAMAAAAWATVPSDFYVDYSAQDPTATVYDKAYNGRVTNNAIDKGLNALGQAGAQVGYNPHGDFTTNTFACAECHRTHDAAGAKLIRRTSNYFLCYACHDGTSSNYNVQAGLVAGTKNSTAGGFETYKLPGAAAAAVSVTSHMRDGLESDTAPGGAPEKNWNLDCINCHNPHGQTVTATAFSGTGAWSGIVNQRGNDRLLESAPITIAANDDVFGVLEPVPAGTVLNIFKNGVFTVGQPGWEFGKIWRMKADPKAGIIGPTFSGLWKTEQGAAKPIVYEVDKNVDGSAQKIIPGTTQPISQPVLLNTIADTSDLATQKPIYTVVRFNAYIVPANKTLRAEFRPIMARPTVMTFTNKYSANEVVNYVYGMNTYCGTCHYDFYQNMGGGVGFNLLTTDGMNGSTARVTSGSYTKAFRHAIGTAGYPWWYDNARNGPWANKFDISIEGFQTTPMRSGTVICQSCHYVHGSSAKNKDIDTKHGGMDNSLLKADDRVVCQACHNKISESDSTPFINETLLNYRVRP